MRSLGPGRLLLVSRLHGKLSSRTQDRQVRPEADKRMTDLFQKMKREGNKRWSAAGRGAPCGSSKTEAIVSEVKRK